VPAYFSLLHKGREHRLDTISSAPAPKQPHIFRRQNVDLGLCDRLTYALIDMSPAACNYRQLSIRRQGVTTFALGCELQADWKLPSGDAMF
jgi:hypothetical protein